MNSVMIRIPAMCSKCMSFTIDVPEDLCDEDATDATVDLDIKWYPPSGSSQEVMHGEIHFECGIPQNYDLTVEKDGEGTTSPSLGTHSYEEDTVVDLSAGPGNRMALR